ncbi:MAG: hypothetical protein PHG00_18035 [Methylococcales bacterium]|nr:hypothetical protein [Methylococcales bacterium]
MVPRWKRVRIWCSWRLGCLELWSGVAYGPHGGSAAWSGGSGYAHGAHRGAAVWSHHLWLPSTRLLWWLQFRPSRGAGIAGLAAGAMIGAAAASRPYPAPPQWWYSSQWRPHH